MKGSLKSVPNGRSGPSGICGKSSLAAEEMKKLQQDLVLLSARISQGNPATSSVVGDLRSTVADARSTVESTSKAEILDDILKKISELDRFILKRTEPVNTDGTRPRRNSNTVDLYCLPTHFMLIDRLVDLHNQSKRPIIVHQHSAAVPEESSKHTAAGARDNEMEAYKVKHDSVLSAMSEKIRALEERSRDMSGEMNSIRTENSKLKTENMKLLTESNMFKSELETLNSRAHVAAVDTGLEERLAAMTQKYTDAMKTCRTLEERIECAASSEQHVGIAILKLAQNIQDDKPLGKLENYLSDQEEVAVYKDSFGRLLTASLDRIDAFKLDIIACTTNAQLLENELSSAKLEKQLMGDDYNSMTVNFNALRVAFSEMESDMIQLRVRLEAKDKAAKDTDAVDKAVMTFRVTANAEIERLQKSLADKESIMEERDREIARYNTHIAMLEQELQEYKDLTEKLKQKVRDITPLDKRELLDSFEEVMQDEMMTMKSAFENKLRLAKGELEVLSKKHQHDIQRLKESNSTIKLLR